MRTTKFFTKKRTRIKNVSHYVSIRDVAKVDEQVRTLNHSFTSIYGTDLDKSKACESDMVPSTCNDCTIIPKATARWRSKQSPVGQVCKSIYPTTCQVIYSQFGLAIHQNDHQARRRFVEWAQNEIAVVPDFHKRILFSDEAHFWLNSYVNKQNCRIWSEANPQVYVETPLHPEKLTVWYALWAGGILLQKR
ncbi:hypothetical protein TNCV_4197111 [Trichonephila clavipes]|nr:hypothetical protein TNCV_4197111 [Trichonephila clavipes]